MLNDGSVGGDSDVEEIVLAEGNGVELVTKAVFPGNDYSHVLYFGVSAMQFWFLH